MLNFNDLNIKKEEVKVLPPTKTKTIKSKPITFAQLNGDEPKKPIQLSKEEIERRKITEPGFKIPISNYQQVAQYCETCEDITTHVCNSEKKKLRCLTCKNDIKYGQES